ncbi:filamentous hemagglutinin [Nostoc sp. 'Peltigera membranacea cyanobiont' 210A]|uniref:two-partner secretion domain-containing protein n=2 Tax=Nostoc sp. 'Peltigera membranacea cyanobiont' 210A TaxID=2014529 RepID=UPI000B9539E0|nr:S-layer family protein [Nostoc sp. 'Peltigera membranacea cyanobiont' 210A]OYD95261.1 filamentous hemagglutinin [Nostoc sp. 'Peltigera membranacea cyanobiont' 210A]
MKALSIRLGLVYRLLTSLMLLPLWTIFLGSGSTYAQVTSDGALNTTVSQNGNNFIINNGTAAGSNLFHSFGQFSVPTGGSATFDLINTPNISTIFSRVTGGSVSNIDGLIRTLNSSNPVSLFLLNPSGIVFGANAKLNIGGSFVGTTADSVVFADGFKFNATNATPPPLLTMSVPVGLQLGANAGTIQVQGPQTPNPLAKLRVQTGQTLALVGSQIDMAGATLEAPDGRIELWGVQNAGITIDNLAGWQLASTVTTPNWGTISLQQSSALKTGGTDGGAIHIQGRGLTVQSSSIAASTVSGQGKGITVQTTEYVNVSGVSPSQGIFNAGLATSVSGNGGRAGNITVETGRLQVSDGAGIRSTSTGNGSRSGDITIRAADVKLNPLSPASAGITGIASLLNGGSGETGNLIIEAERIGVFNGGRIGTDMRVGTGIGGDITIHASESLEISGTSTNRNIGVTSGITSTIGLNANGQGGNIAIDTGRLMLSKGGSISSAIGGIGRAGNIDIRATDVSVSDLAIDANTRTLSGISVSIGEKASGQGGNINLQADRLSVFNGGQITSSSLGQGSAGSVNLRVNDIDVQGISQALPDGRILPSTITASSANAFTAGSVNITADSLRVRDGAEITVSNSGTGDAGNLNINARNIFLDNGASLRAEANGGSRGNIRLQASDFLLLRHGSNIITNARGASTGGNIDISAGSIVAIPQENSDISANAVLGQGGNIQITTQGIFGLKFRPQLTPESDITASSQFGVSGTVQVNTIGIDPNSGLVELPVNVTDPSQQIATGCAGSEGSRFVATGRGGVPQNPLQQVTSNVYDGLRLRTWSDIRNLTAYRKTGEVIAQIPTKEAVLVQAKGWRRNADGKIEIFADKSPTQVQPALTCAAVPRS